MSSVNNCSYSSDVGLPCAVGLSVRVRYLQAESNALSANFAFCHFANTSYIKPPLAKRHLQY